MESDAVESSSLEVQHRTQTEIIAGTGLTLPCWGTVIPIGAVKGDGAQLSCRGETTLYIAKVLMVRGIVFFLKMKEHLEPEAHNSFGNG